MKLFLLSVTLSMLQPTLFYATDLQALSHAFASEAGFSETPAAEFSFGQSWLKKTQESFLPGHVALYPSKNGLVIIASLNDETIHSNATAMNQPMWELGDTFEIFVGVPDQPEYWELHVTPNNHRLQLVWNEQTLSSFRKKTSAISDHIIPDLGFSTSTTRINHAENYWQVYVFLPWASIALSDGCDSYSLELAFCRYDGNQSVQAPILSSTAPFSRRNFHLREQWHRINLNLRGESEND